MAAQGETLTPTAPSAPLDQAGIWFWNFLKAEFSPYPGRGWVVARMTIAATIVMLLIMIFRLPNGFLGTIFTLLLSRENPAATLRAGIRTTLAFAISTAYTLLGVMTLVDDPLTHFLWIMLTLFLAFFLISVLPDYAAAVAFGFLIGGAIPLWDVTTLSVNTRLENTLWLAFSVLVGSAVTIAVEYVLRRVHPTTDLTEAIETRLHAVEYVLRNVASQVPVDPKIEKEISLFSSVGTSRLRRLLLRSGYSSHFVAQMNAAVALLGRLVDVAASLRLFHSAHPIVASEDDSQRCLHLADRIAELRRRLMQHELPRGGALTFPDGPTSIPFLSDLEKTVALIPQAFSGSESITDFFIPAPMDEEIRQRLLVADAFSNPAHLQFALRGMLAAMACYIVYTAIDWQGLNTAILTCIITALSTIGASRQKQFLRLAGTIIGGFIFGMGAQVFVLPYVDSMVGFTLLFAVVTAICAWIGTSSPRISYLGVQVALAFYAIHLQEFTIQTSLAVARDRVFGVLLALAAMGLIFDRLWVRNALDEMQARFSRNLQMLAELTDQLLKEDRNEAVKRIRQLRDQIGAGFDAVKAQSDGILFEFGPERQRKLKVREVINRWQPLLRTLLQVQVTFAQYRIQRPLQALPETIATGHITFEKDVASMARAMADEVSGKTPQPVPDIGASAANLEQEIRSYYAEQGAGMAADTMDVINLSQNLASILTHLHDDIHSTLASRQAQANGRLPESGILSPGS